MKIAFTDGEMTNLNPKFGQLLCACVLAYNPEDDRGGRLTTLVLDDYVTQRWDDSGLARAWRDEIEQYDIIVTWNGKHFDLPFLDARLGEYGLRPLQAPRHEDLMFTFRRHLRCMHIANSKLDTVARHLRLPVQKTPMIPQQWVKAIGGHRPSYDRIITHCEHDVRVLAAAWPRAKHLVREIK